MIKNQCQSNALDCLQELGRFIIKPHTHTRSATVTLIVYILGYNPYGPPARTPYPTATPTTTTSSIGGYPGMGTGYGTAAPYPATTSASTPYPSQPTGGYPPTQTAAPYPATTTTSSYPSYPAPTYTNPAAGNTISLRLVVD